MNDQRSTTDQLRDAVGILNREGLYDAADFIRRHVEDVDRRAARIGCLVGAVAVSDDPGLRAYLDAPAFCVTCGVQLRPDEPCEQNVRPWGFRHPTCVPTDVAAPERGGKEER